MEAENEQLGKEALGPGQCASFRNYTSFAKDINGIMVDVATLASTNLTDDNFEIRVDSTGFDSDPAQ